MRPCACKVSRTPVVAALAVMLGDQLLVEVLGGEVPVAGVEQRQHPQHLVERRAPGRDPAQAAVVETLRPIRLVAIAPAPEGPLRYAQHLRRLGLAQQPCRGPRIQLLELHQSQSLYLLRPTHPNPPWSGCLLKPDRSSGTPRAGPPVSAPAAPSRQPAAHRAAPATPRWRRNGFRPSAGAPWIVLSKSLPAPLLPPALQACADAFSLHRWHGNVSTLRASASLPRPPPGYRTSAECR